MMISRSVRRSVCRSLPSSRQLHTSTTSGKVKTNKILPRGSFGPRKPMAQKRKEIELLREKYENENRIAREAGFERDWVLKTAILVERPAILEPEPPEWVRKYVEWKKKWSAPYAKQEPSIDDFLTTVEEEMEKLSGKKSKSSVGDKDLDEREQRAAELRKQYEIKLEQKVGPRITKADKLNDRKSLRRALDSKLYLIVKKDRDDYAWQLPTGIREDISTDTIRQTAEKRLADIVGNSIQTYFCSNAPIGFYTYPFPPALQKQYGAYGAKVFVFYSWYIQGNLRIKRPDIVDYAWVTRKELHEYIDPKTMEVLDEILPYEPPFVPDTYK